MFRIINRIATAVMICLVASPGQAQDLSTLPKPLAEKVEAARKTCANFENGNFALEWGVVEVIFGLLTIFFNAVMLWPYRAYYLPILTTWKGETDFSATLASHPASSGLVAGSGR